MNLWQGVDAMGWVVFVLLNGHYLALVWRKITTFDRTALGFEALFIVVLDLMNHVGVGALVSISSYSWGLAGYAGLCAGLRFSDDAPTRLLRWMYRWGRVSGAVMVFYLLMFGTVFIESHRPGGYVDQISQRTGPTPKR